MLHLLWVLGDSLSQPANYNRLHPNCEVQLFI
jgi:hypothetical protein